MANRLADMHDVAPELTEAVAERITTRELHDAALARPRRVRAPHRRRGRAHVRRPDRRRRAARRRRPARARPRAAHRRRRPRAGRAAARLRRPTSSSASSTRWPRAPGHGRCKLRVDAALRDRARAGRYAYVHDRGPDFAAGIWVVDPLFMLDARPPASSTDDNARRAGTRRRVLRRRRPRRRRPARGRARRPRARKQQARQRQRRGDTAQPRARPRPARRPDGPHAPSQLEALQGDRLPPARRATTAT